MKPKINFLIKPVTLRFSLWNGTPIYHFCGEAEAQLEVKKYNRGLPTESKHKLVI